MRSSGEILGSGTPILWQKAISRSEISNCFLARLQKRVSAIYKSDMRTVPNLNVYTFDRLF